MISLLLCQNIYMTDFTLYNNEPKTFTRALRGCIPPTRPNIATTYCLSVQLINKKSGVIDPKKVNCAVSIRDGCMQHDSCDTCPDI